ncbi:MAG TPA: aminotransferase class IV [Isosphaeraceae bacterium]|nr:aminotransferase class IV [Isosphaeraceae bacterium]
MIWVGGRIVPEAALTISVRDRTFEHGLGLFETLRTWQLRAPLLDRHLARLERSARALGLPLDPSALPNDGAVAALLDANGAEDDVLLRITLSGGFDEVEGSTLWMRAGPLPPPMRHEGAVVDLGSWGVVRYDPIARHKTLNYWTRRQAYERARSLGYDEVLCMTGDDYIWGGSRTNVFLVAGDRLVTPSLDGPIVPGIMRGLVIEQAPRLAMGVRNKDDMTRNWLEAADEVFLTNSVRGIIPVARVGESSWPAPGPWTKRLAIGVDDWLNGRGGTTA